MTRLDPWETELIQALNDGLPLTERPYADLAARLGVDEAKILARLQSWVDDGTIRRFGVRLKHRRLGIAANGMSVWDVPDARVEEAAACMTRRPEVTHCYLRTPHPSWPYNLYAMIHGPDEQAVHAIAEDIAREAGLDSFRILFSTRELKKRAPRYFADSNGDADA
ncbi:MAG: Lrp/AsnC family transcriptional regulator [Candidatus Hydrogenedentes bacterium]|nr:Lrp/AsnC family transcriptional regulator [Candidatus Hydrogenedentota bacterium]